MRDPDPHHSSARLQPAPAKASARADAMLAVAIEAASRGIDELAAVLDTIPAPIYVTDCDGWVRSFNRACIDFAGRTPVAGQDRWCVTWRLYDEKGTFLPHDQCPMAIAIGEQEPNRGVVAVAERPDGSRVMFTPYPTPIHDAAGNMIGAVNMLIDVTDLRQADSLHAQAVRCRRLAATLVDQRTVDILKQMAIEYDDQASRLRGD
jgi:PAS domain S-box-containing protein